MSSTSPFRLDGLNVLVTGAGGGIGQALVTAFRAARANVSGADRTLEALDGLNLAHRLVADQADLAATDLSIHDYLQRAGTPDVVISNAGYTRAELFEDVDLAVWQSELAINLSGAYALTAPIVEAMAARGSGSLTFIASVNGLLHLGNPAYSAAKAGLIAYAKSIAVERGSRGVRANTICPGSVHTPAWDHRFAADASLMRKVLPLYPLGRLVTAADVANAAVFLSSPAAAGITGVSLPVDAGLTAGNMHFINDVLRHE